MRWPRGTRRLARILAVTLAALVGLLLLVVVLLFVRPLREEALDHVLQAASDALPGEISVERAGWPGLGHLELEGLRWTLDGTEVAAAARVAARVDVGGLFRRDLHVRELTTVGVRADLPRIEAAFAGGDSVPEPTGTSGGGPPPFPRPGALPRVPSIGIDSLRVEVVRLAVADSLTLTADLALGAELRHGRAPVFELRHLDAAWLERDWHAGSDGLRLDPHTAAAEGTLGIDLGPDRHFDLRLESGEDRRFRLAFSERGRDPAREGLLLTGSFTRRADGVPDSVEFTADLHTPPLERIEAWLGRPDALTPLAPLGAVVLHAEGSAHLGDEPDSRVVLELGASGWPGRISARLRSTGAEVEAEELVVRADGLELDATGRYADGEWTAELDAAVRGLDAFAAFVDTSTVPADLRSDLRLRARGAGARIEPELELTAVAPSAGLDSLAVDARGVLDGADTDLRVALRAAALEGRLATAVDARLRDLDRPKVHLAPIRLATSLDALATAEPGATPTIEFDPEEGTLAVAGLELTGAAGEMRVDGRVSEASGGEGRIELRWPVPPEALELAGFDTATRDTLLAPVWSTGDTPGDTPGVELRFELAPGARDGEVEATLDLPAPWKLVAGLPDEAYAAPDLLGDLQARWSADGAWNAELDLARTAWLDSAFVHAGGADGITRLDSLLVRGGPTRATAAATLDSSAIDGKFQLDLVSDPTLRLLLPRIPEDLQFLVNLRVGVAGSPGAPDARARLLASARGPTLELPLLSAEVEVVEAVLRRGFVELPQATRIGQFAVDSARVDLAPVDPGAGLIPLRVATDIRGDLGLRHSALIDSAAGAWTVHSDSLHFGARGKPLRSEGPFDLVVAPADSTIRLTGLDLRGEPGSLRAALELTPRTTDADLELHLDASLPAALVQMPAQMLPTGFHLTAQGTEEDLQAAVWVEGLDVGPREDVLARIDAHRAGDTFEIDVNASDELGTLASGEIVVPLAVDLLRRTAEWRDGDLRGTVRLDSLPLPWKIGDDAGFGRSLLGAQDRSAPLLDAELRVAGTGRAPVGGAVLDVTFPEIEQLAGDRIELRALWTGPTGDASGLGLFDDPTRLERLRQEVPDGGIAVRASLLGGDRERAHAFLGLPLSAGSPTPWPDLGPEGQLHYDVAIDSLRLEEWDTLAPPGTAIEGGILLKAQGEGPIGDLPLDLALRLDRVRFQQSFGSSATLEGRIDVSGTRKAPVIEGEIRVPSALVRLPDSSRELHPVEGESKLWNLPAMSPDRLAAADSLQVDWGWSFSPVDTAAADEAPPITLAEATRMDVKITIPNSFWIRGHGLEIQLAGDLHVELADGVPRVVGELRAIGGSIDIVGARLRMESGTVTFYGGDTQNPALDLRLSRDVGEVRVFVNVTGTAQEPRIEFESDPPMAQADIMSYLLFGAPSGELDGAQNQLLQDQAAAALSQFAAPLLENELTQSLGISMIQLQAGDDPDDGLSLVVGKYVTPQILVKYEQSLRDRQKYTVNAEYWLNQNFRVETQLSETESTGIFLNWSNDY